jgi:hypothetical protein
MLPGMAEPAPVFDPRAVIDGRVPGLRKTYFYAGMALAAACAIIALAVYLAESVADGRGVVPFAIALPSCRSRCCWQPCCGWTGWNRSRGAT